MKNKVKVVVFEHDDIGDDIPTSPREFIEFWENKINMIPAEYFEESAIELKGETISGNDYLGVFISYNRDETDEEEIKRLDDIATRCIFVESQERKQLAILRKKYGA